MHSGRKSVTDGSFNQGVIYRPTTTLHNCLRKNSKISYNGSVRDIGTNLNVKPKVKTNSSFMNKSREESKDRISSNKKVSTTKKNMEILFNKYGNKATYMTIDSNGSSVESSPRGTRKRWDKSKVNNILGHNNSFINCDENPGRDYAYMSGQEWKFKPGRTEVPNKNVGVDSKSVSKENLRNVIEKIDSKGPMGFILKYGINEDSSAELANKMDIIGSVNDPQKWTKEKRLLSKTGIDGEIIMDEGVFVQGTNGFGQEEYVSLREEMDMLKKEL